MGLLTYLKQIFQDADGAFSSKRTVTLASFVLLALAFLCNLFFKLQISQFMFDNMTYIVLGGLGMTAAEPLTIGFRDRATANVPTE